jgi:ATP-dependent protease ClpP protease subunit
VPSDDKYIYDWYGIEATSPKEVSDALDKARGQPVDVEINSGGGDIFAGSEIYTALRSYKGGVNVFIVGLAASAASVIAMAGKSQMSPTAMMMVHNVSSYAEGDYRDMGHQSEVLQKANKTIASAYVAKSGMSEKDALAMMDNETWLTAQQAVDKKLVDKVMFSDNAKMASAFNGLLPQSVIDKTRAQLAETPDKLKAKLNLLKVKVKN